MCKIECIKMEFDVWWAPHTQTLDTQHVLVTHVCLSLRDYEKQTPAYL